MSGAIDRRTLLLGFGGTAISIGFAEQAIAAKQPPPPIRLEDVFARAETAKHKRTIYENTSAPPSETLSVWPVNKKSDCSGFVGWCFGLPRKPPQLIDLKLGTNQIYDDATGVQHYGLFLKIDTPLPGDVVVYPNYQYAPGKGDSGHVALLTGKDAQGLFTTIECASSPYHDPKINDAIAFNRGESIFIKHGKWMEDVRKRNLGIPPDMTRAPIYARYLGLVR